MSKYIIHIMLRLFFIVLIAADFRLNWKMKKNDQSLHRQLNQKQKIERVFYYIVLIIGLIVPFSWPMVLVTVLSMVYFFYFTDREIYVNRHYLYLRGKYYDFKHISHLSYENSRLRFTYQNEKITLSHPLLSQEIIEKEIVQRARHIEEKAARKKQHKRA